MNILTFLSPLRFGWEKAITKEAFYDLVDHDMNDNEVSMSSFKNKVLLVTNVASNGKLANRNYTELSALIDELGPRGLQVLAFPCNQFMAQEPGTHEEILTFVDRFGLRDKITWFEKADVNGAQSREVFGFLKNAIKEDNGTKDIRWNFTKFLVDHKGQPYKRYGPKTSPFKFKADIVELLDKMEKSSASS